MIEDIVAEVTGGASVRSRLRSATATVLAEHVPPPRPVYFVSAARGDRSEDWLADGAPWSWAKAQRLCRERTCWRNLPGRFAPGRDFGPSVGTIHQEWCELVALSVRGWRSWLQVRPSTVADGLGVFAARSFVAGDVVTQYVGRTSSNPRSQQHILSGPLGPYSVLRQDGVLVYPPSLGVEDVLFAGHLLKQSETPNCVLQPDMVIRTLRLVRCGMELTLKYRDDRGRS
jgi:hypothetical protein